MYAIYFTNKMYSHHVTVMHHTCLVTSQACVPHVENPDIEGVAWGLDPHPERS